MKTNRSSPITYNDAYGLLGLQVGMKYSTKQIDAAYKRELDKWNTKRSTATTPAALARAVAAAAFLQEARNMLFSVALSETRPHRVPKAPSVVPKHPPAPGPVISHRNAPGILHVIKSLAAIFRGLVTGVMSAAEYMKSNGVPQWAVVTLLVIGTLTLVRGCTLLCTIGH